MATKTKTPPDWIPSRVAAIARTLDTTTMHPRETGFGIRVSPKGKAVWFFRFRGPDDNEISGTIGEVGAVSDGAKVFDLADALERYRAARRGAFSPPAPVVAPLATDLTLLEAFERWLREHKKSDGSGGLAAATVDYYKVAVGRYLKEAHNWVLAEKRTVDWLPLLNSARARSKSKTRGLMFLLGSIYEHFIELDVLTANPIDKRIMRTTFAGKDTKVRNNTMVHAVDLPAFFQAVQQLRVHSRDAVMLLLLTGWRRSAVMSMKWADVDTRRGVYTIGAGYLGWKGLTGEIALGGYAVGLLEERREKMSAKKGGLGEYVFPARTGKNARAPFQQDVRGALEPMDALLGYHIVPQDLRRTFITVAELVLDGNMRLVGRLVGHKQKLARSGGQGREDDDANPMTATYVVDILEREKLAAFTVQETLYEIAGALPMSDQTQALLTKAGMDPARLTLIEEPDDEEDDA